MTVYDMSASVQKSQLVQRQLCRNEVDSDHLKHVMRRYYQLLKYFLENLNNYLRIFV